MSEFEYGIDIVNNNYNTVVVHTPKGFAWGDTLDIDEQTATVLRNIAKNGGGMLYVAHFDVDNVESIKMSGNIMSDGTCRFVGFIPQFSESGEELLCAMISFKEVGQNNLETGLRAFKAQ